MQESSDEVCVEGEEPGRNVSALFGDMIRRDPLHKHEHPPLCPAGGKHQHIQIFIFQNLTSLTSISHLKSVGEDGWLDGGDDDYEWWLFWGFIIKLQCWENKKQNNQMTGEGPELSDPSPPAPGKLGLICYGVGV